MSRYLLLLNRGSGGNERGLDAGEVCKTVEGIFRAAGHEISSWVMEPKGIDAALEQAIREGPDGVIIAGGDGTVSAAARHFGGTEIALGVLPMGTFNLAARDLGVPLEISEAAEFLAGAVVHAVDVLDVGGHACLCTVILGFYPEFARTFEKRDHGGRWWRKALKLITYLPRFFAEARPLHLSWTGDGGEGQARTKFSAFVPGRYKASAGIVPARTDFQSGNLTAYIGTQRTAQAAMRGMLDYVFGRQDLNAELIHFQSAALEVRGGRRGSCVLMLDGEIMRMRFPLVMKILPGHLRVLTTAAALNEEPPETP